MQRMLVSVRPVTIKCFPVCVISAQITVQYALIPLDHVLHVVILPLVPLLVVPVYVQALLQLLLAESAIQ